MIELRRIRVFVEYELLVNQCIGIVPSWSSGKLPRSGLVFRYVSLVSAAEALGHGHGGLKYSRRRLVVCCAGTWTSETHPVKLYLSQDSQVKKPNVLLLSESRKVAADEETNTANRTNSTNCH